MARNTHGNEYEFDYEDESGHTHTDAFRGGYSDIDLLTRAHTRAVSSSQSVTILKNGVPTFRVTEEGRVQVRAQGPRLCTTQVMKGGKLPICPNQATWFHKRYSGPVCDEHKETLELITGPDGWSNTPLQPEHWIETVDPRDLS